MSPRVGGDLNPLRSTMNTVLSALLNREITDHDEYKIIYVEI